MDRLTARVVRRGGWPAYPTKLDVEAQPGLLRPIELRRWPRRRDLRRLFELLVGAGALSGAAGCTFGAPAYMPVMTEPEALRIITDELGARSIRLTREKVTLPTVTLPAVGGGMQHLVADRATEDGSCVIEYFTLEDLSRWRECQFYDNREAVRKLESAVREQDPSLHFGGFYQECVTGSDRERAKQARELLCRQIEEFIKWLEGQGVI
jgi:hypothetical protein